MLNTFKRKLRQFARWLLLTIQPAPDEIDAAILMAFAEVGLPIDEYSHEFDLLHSGKFHAVLLHTSHILGNPLITVGDLKGLLT